LHLFLGDICGYYYRQNEIIDILREMPYLEASAGNHDVLFLMSLKNEDLMMNYTENFGRSFEFLRETITPNSLEFLKNLQESIFLSQYGIAGYHGSPWKPLNEYIYPDSSMEAFEELPFSLVFLGHTHYSMDRIGTRVRVINPGSSGQPRDGGWPSYALYDTQTQKLEIKRVQYNVKNLKDEIIKRKEKQSYLTAVLERISI
jgi:diadenosine tetraphosphatase ApaH/serine/threonine PP2A family protein phosphatase